MSITLINSSIPSINHSNPNAKYSLKAVITENSINTAANTSNVTLTVYLQGPWNPSFYGYNVTTRIKVDNDIVSTNDTVYFSVNNPVNMTYKQTCSTTLDIAHSANGTKTALISVYLATDGNDYFLPVNNTYVLGNLSLTPINRGLVRIKHSGEWKTALPYVKNSGEWVLCSCYLKENGQWSICI